MIVCARCRAEYEDAQTRFCGRCGADMRGAAPAAADGGDALLGRVIDGRYRVLGLIGRGGMGAVYRVEHVAMGKQAAMKLLHPSLAHDAEVVERFRREAEAVSRLSHANTVQVFDFGVSQGLMYLVMELVRGEDLGVVLRRDGPLPFARLGPLAVQMCDALTEAHAEGVVHRDLKPENVIVARARDGRDLVKVLDFGLAKLRDVEERTRAQPMTARGSLLGTPFYMSPEQIRADALDGRSDLYSLGALLYRALTGQPPFTANAPMAILTQHLTAAPLPPSERAPTRAISAAADAVVLRAMAKAREDRFASAEEMKAAILEALADEPEHAATTPPSLRRRSDQSGVTGVTAVSPPTPLQRADFDAYERGLKRRRWAGLALVPLVLVLAGAAAVVLVSRGGARVRDVEREPNDAPAQANPIAAGRPVRGQIGRRLAVEESDRDFYRLAVKGEPAALRVEVSGLPNMELKVEVFDGSGRKLGEADNGGVGDGEVIPNLRVEPGDCFVAVREVWTAGKPATENISDWYTLVARLEPLAAGREVEPDDTPATALPLALGAPLRGYLSSADDVDYYRPRGSGGRALGGEVSGVAGVDIRLVVLPGGAASGPPGALPPGARVYDAGGVGAGEHFDGFPWPAGAAAPLVVVERKAPRGGGHVVEGVDREYTLRVWQAP